MLVELTELDGSRSLEWNRWTLIVGSKAEEQRQLVVDRAKDFKKSAIKCCLALGDLFLGFHRRYQGYYVDIFRTREGLCLRTLSGSRQSQSLPCRQDRSGPFCS